MNALTGIAVGVGLSAASGFRAFVPLLVTSLAARAGFLRLAPGMEWIATDPALIAFATATILEVLAYFNPWVDKLLDTIATPIALIAGTVVTAAAVTDLPPLIRWTVAILAGGGAAGIFQMSTVLLRLKSTMTTAGLANPVVAAAELIGALVLSILALVAPRVCLAIVVWACAFVIRGAGHVLRRPRETGQGPG
jgi:hypothetical protein